MLNPSGMFILSGMILASLISVFSLFTFFFSGVLRVNLEYFFSFLEEGGGKRGLYDTILVLYFSIILLNDRTGIGRSIAYGIAEESPLRVLLIFPPIYTL